MTFNNLLFNNNLHNISSRKLRNVSAYIYAFFKKKKKINHFLLVIFLKNLQKSNLSSCDFSIDNFSFFMKSTILSFSIYLILSLLKSKTTFINSFKESFYDLICLYDL